MLYLYKSKICKIVSVLLVVAILFTTSDLSFLGLNNQVQAQEEQEKVVVEDKSEPVEVPEENTEYATVYDNGDGTKTAYVYTEPIRYEDKDGNLVDINNSIVEMTQEEKQKQDKEDYYATNNSGEVEIYLPDNLTEEQNNVLLKKDEYAIEMKPAVENNIGEKDSWQPGEIIQKDVYNADGTTEKENSIISYESPTDESITLQYQPTNNGVKHNIVLQEKPDSNKFTYEVDLRGLIPKKIDDGRIMLYDEKTKELAGQFQEPYMIDSSEPYNYSDKVSMEITQKTGDIYILTLSADEEFLSNPQNKYPIIIDPTVTMSGEYDTFDTFVQSAYATSNFYLVDHIKTGWASETGKIRSYIKFNLPDISGGLVTSAKVKFYEFTGNTSSAYTDLYRSAGSWSSSGITWNNQPGYTGSSYGQLVVNHAGWYEWNVTSLASGWYSGSITNNGFVLKDRDENARFRRYYSSDNGSNKPVLTVTYSTKPAAPTVTMNSSGVNSTTSYANVSWSAVSGASKYKVGVWNGYQYEWFDVGTATSWSTNGKKIWPTTTEINSMSPPDATILHFNSAGTELANDPAILYAKQNQGYNNNHTYYFRVRAYNSANQYSESTYKNLNAIDTTKPNKPASTSISLATMAVNSADSASITASWSAAGDLPAFSNSGVKQYRVQLLIGSTVNEEKIVSSTTTTLTFTNKPDNTSNIKVQVRAEDNNGNYSDWSVSNAIATPDRTPPAGPTSLTLNPSGWTNTNTLTLNWSGASDANSSISRIEYKIDSGSWTSTGLNTASGSKAISTSSLANGQHTIYTRTVDAQGNYTTAPKTAIYYRDATAPTAVITSPTVNSVVHGTINVVGTASDAYFKNYKIEISPSGQNNWTMIGTEKTTQITNGNLQSINTTIYSDGNYKIRLTVTDNNNNSVQIVDYITIDNNAEGNGVEIASPETGSLVDGKITITGKAFETTFTSASLSYGQGENPTQWQTIKTISTPVSEEAELANWDTTALESGAYTIKLTVNDAAGHTINKTAKVIIPEREKILGLGTEGDYPYASLSKAEINTVTGNMILNTTDATLPVGTGPEMAVTRTYNSKDKTLGLLGWAWQINIPSLEEKQNNNIEITDETGAKITYTYNSDGTYTSPQGHYETLTKDSLGLFSLNYKDGSKTTFDLTENKVHYIDNNGYMVTWTTLGDSITITDSYYRTITLNIDIESNRITNITYGEEPEIWAQYEYDNVGNLVKVTTLGGVVTAYTYDKEHNLLSVTTPNENEKLANEENYTPKQTKYQYTDGKLNKVTDVQNVGTIVAYEGNKTTVAFAPQTENQRIKEYYLDNENRLEKIVDVDSENTDDSRETIYQYLDENNPALNTAVITKKASDSIEAGEKAQYDYDAKGNTIAETSIDGQMTLYTYDQDNYLHTKTSPDGKVTTYTYDENHNITGDGETTYEYDGTTHLLTKTTDKEGLKTTYTYNEYGYQNSTKDNQDITTTSTAYDAKGRILTETTQEKIATYTYTKDGNITKITEQYPATGTEQAKTLVTTYTYDKENNKLTETTPEGIKYSYTYDALGNATKTVAQDEDGIISTQQEVEYVPGTSDVQSETDAEGNSVEYTYDEVTGQVETQTDAQGQVTEYDYDSMDRVTSVQAEAGGQTVSNGYTYENDKIKSIIHNGFSYNFGYDENGNNTTISVGNQTLLTNTYQGSNLASTQYENDTNLLIQYTYNENDKITSRKYNEDVKFSYKYYDNEQTDGNHLGLLKTLVDNVNSVTYTYTYDDKGRVSQIQDNTGEQNKIIYTYTPGDFIDSITYTLGRQTKTQTYTYDETNRAKEVNYGENKLTYTYDSLGRTQEKTITKGAAAILSTGYTYKTVDGQDTKTTDKIQSITNNNEAINYEYDSKGNIISITSGQTTTRYQYDGLNQLIREDNGDLNNTITYTYDTGGNITQKKEYSYTTGEITTEPQLTMDYTYGNATWKDQLTAYNGEAITYDEIGNPITYGSITYNWEAGRQLTGYTDTKGTAETEDDTTISYKYNDSGIRTEKTVNGVTTHYYLEGDKVIRETDGTDTIWYTYDTADNLISMNLNGEEYYYERNAQNDIIGILDQTGAEVVSYTYDSWGKIISIDRSQAETIGEKNPYRYRGYRYDEETGLYYLQSRYYNSEWGRFVNGDDLSILQLTQGELMSHNLYAYCSNNPINFVDKYGFLAYPGQIHNAVVNDIYKRYRGTGIEKEKRILYRNSRNWGRCDLINFKTRKIWEVKRITSSFTSAKKQLQKYLDGKPNQGNYKYGQFTAGGYIKGNSFVVRTSTTDYYVNYYYAGSGIIYYDYDRTINTKVVKGVIIGVVIVGAVILVPSTGGLSLVFV